MLLDLFVSLLNVRTFLLLAKGINVSYYSPIILGYNYTSRDRENTGSYYSRTSSLVWTQEMVCSGAMMSPSLDSQQSITVRSRNHENKCFFSESRYLEQNYFAFRSTEVRRRVCRENNSLRLLGSQGCSREFGGWEGTTFHYEPRIYQASRNSACSFTQTKRGS